ncbi:MAG: hypothetical protein IJ318_03930 [Clostridia bacterium]|nr:hypothetical protein [Clostridia bacterium]
MSKQNFTSDSLYYRKLSASEAKPHLPATDVYTNSDAVRITGVATANSICERNEQSDIT